MDYYLYAKEKLYEQLRCLMKEEDLVREGADGEALHRMRVSSRRLRAALRVFQGIFPTDKALTWKKRIRKIGRALGEGRELDIQIQLFTMLKEKVNNPAQIGAIEDIMKFLRLRRKSAQERIVSVLDDLKTQKKIGDFQRYLKGLSNKGHSFAGDVSLSRKKTMILNRLEQLLKYKPYVRHPEEVKKLHRMRIAAKNLRYTLEIFRVFYGAKIEKYVRASLGIQDVLGDLHEYDVCLDLLGKLKAGHGNGKDFAQTVGYLQSKFSSLRQKTYGKFVKIWDRSEQEGTWAELKRMV